MPYRINYDSRRRLVVKPFGHCELTDSLAMLRELAAHQGENCSAGALLDFRAIDYSPSLQDIHSLAEEAGRGLHMPLALVVDGTLNTGIARQFAAYAEALGGRVGVFADPEAAINWLREDA